MKTVLLLLLLSGCYNGYDAESDARKSGAGKIVVCRELGDNQTYSCFDEYGQIFLCDWKSHCIRMTANTKLLEKP